VIFFVDVLASGLTLVLVIALITVGILYVIDRTQTRHAVRRNFPVIGRLRYVFENLGEFFREYFFAMDREEMPFNRAERSWVYRAAKGVDSTVAFGSTRDLRPAGTILFSNCAYPPLDGASEPTRAIIVGPHCRKPYETRQREPYADAFLPVPPLQPVAESEAGDFDCRVDVLRHPRETKEGVTRADVAPGADCCAPGDDGNACC